MTREERISKLVRFYKGEVQAEDLKPKQYTFLVGVDGEPHALFVNGCPVHSEKDWQEYHDMNASCKGEMKINVNIVD